ncbi:hypothetical protein ABCS02_10645 [Microbacterium sp. X-17]|uniref:hypothetical protein n=1 Tax=Microbacterium sp. X-17 TaxID=3144404 RepID=UPI0031F54C7B
MTAPQPGPPAPQGRPASASALRAAIWVAIGALIAAAIVCVIWVLVGAQNGIVGRAFLTILLLAAFAGVAILDVHLAARRPTWFALVSMGSWIVSLLIGAFLIWMPQPLYSWGVTRLFSFLLIVLVLQLAVLHLRLYTRAYLRHPMLFTAIVTWVTVGLVAVLVIMLVLPLMLWEWVDFHDVYWRIVVAVTILATVGTALVPLVNALFAPRRPRPVAPPAAAPVAWPTYVDGVTPLPILPDGTPDWNAYYTGHPTYAPPPAGSVPPAPHAQPGYQGYPPPPPLPPSS